mgnify:CR=1 FL=1
MVVNPTELQNNFDKYLKLCKIEEVIVSSNGKNIAMLVKYNEELLTNLYKEGVICEKSLEYHSENTKTSYEDFLKMKDASDKHYEFINGQIYLMASPSYTHQKIQSNLFLIFGNWFKGKNCTPLVSPFDITLTDHEDNKNVVQPDIVIICNPEEMLDEKDRYIGTPSLIVEILSKATRSRDMVLKLNLYMSSGVKEYWIINTFNKEIHLYLFENNEISETRTWKIGESTESIVFKGLTANLGDVFSI